MLHKSWNRCHGPSIPKLRIHRLSGRLEYPHLWYMGMFFHEKHGHNQRILILLGKINEGGSIHVAEQPLTQEVVEHRGEDEVRATSGILPQPGMFTSESETLLRFGSNTA